MTCCRKDRKKEVHRTVSFNLESDWSLSTLITEAVAEEKGVDVTDLTPLRHVIDIDGSRAAIDAVQETPDGVACISFTYETYLVTVTSDGTIEIATPR